MKRARSIVYNWIHNADRQPETGQSPDQVAADETAIRLDVEQYWLYAAVNLRTNRSLHTKLESTGTDTNCPALVCELRAKHAVNDVFLTDSATPLQTMCRRHGLESCYKKHGDYNSVEHVFWKVKSCSIPFGNLFSRVGVETSDELSRSFYSHGTNLIEYYARPPVGLSSVPSVISFAHNEERLNCRC